ncbi:NDR1/HIN1-like protein [Luteimonas sp. e5]
MKALRILVPLLLVALLAACASGGSRRVSEPAASIQQLSVDASGGWTLNLRLQNYSAVAMRFDRIELALDVGGAKAGTLSAQPGLSIPPESADVIELTLTPDAQARLQVADALAAGRSIGYRLQGRVHATPDGAGMRQFQVQRDSALSPAPGLPGVLR